MICESLFFGHRSEADKALEDLARDHADGDAYQIAEVFAIRGEIDSSFEWLDRSLNEHDPGYYASQRQAPARRLHDDERWLPFLKIDLDQPRRPRCCSAKRIRFVVRIVSQRSAARLRSSMVSAHSLSKVFGSRSSGFSWLAYILLVNHWSVTPNSIPTALRCLRAFILAET